MGALGFVVLPSFLCGISVIKIPHHRIVVTSNPTINYAMFVFLDQPSCSDVVIVVLGGGGGGSEPLPPLEFLFNRNSTLFSFISK